MTTVPVVVTSSGFQPQSPASLREQIVALATAASPGLTANLPGSLIEDIASTDTGAAILCDQAFVDLGNSVTPYGTNAVMLNQFGQIYGVPKGIGTNTSVYVVFTGSVGFVIPRGFTVSDGTYQYTVQDGGIVPTSGTTGPLYCLATQEGTWAVPINTVTTIITSVPGVVTLSVTNPQAGTPGLDAQSEEDYRAQVIQAGLAGAQGMPRFVKAQLENVSGVQSRLISMIQKSGKWEVIVGGGDPYEVADAIFRGLFDISTLVGSTILVTGITAANPGVVTTDLNHGYTTGQVVYINGIVGPTSLNGVPLTITVLSQKTFSIGVNTTALPAWTSGGVVTPNLRNISVNINNFPDTYTIPFVNPPVQTVNIGLTWNTTSTNIVSPSAVAAAGSPVLVGYVNSLPVGQPMNLFELQSVFQDAVASLIPPQLLTRMVFSISINGVGVSPSAGTGIIAGDPESYFLTNSTLVSITQG